MNNFELDNGKFIKEDERKIFFKYIPGFRSNKKINKVIAYIYYSFCVLTIFMATNIVDILLSTVLVISSFIICGIIDFILKKEKRNIKSIVLNIVMPFVALIICSLPVGSDKYIYDVEIKAAKSMGITLSEYNDVINKYNETMEKYTKLDEVKETTSIEYKNKKDEYENLVNEFEEYKKLVPENSIEELERVKESNENYKGKISDLENKISELNKQLD